MSESTDLPEVFTDLGAAILGAPEGHTKFCRVRVKRDDDVEDFYVPTGSTREAVKAVLASKCTVVETDRVREREKTDAAIRAARAATKREGT